MVRPARCAPLVTSGKPLSGSFVYKEDIPGYIKFLDKGLENYKK